MSRLVRTMKSTDENGKKMDFDDEDNLSVPAGTARVVVGLIMMSGGVVAAALSNKAWVKIIGLLMFFLSPFVMLKRPDKRR